MKLGIAILAVAAFVTSTWLTWVVRKGALFKGVLDVPNERSSHAQPTPRGGGVAIVLTASVFFVLLALFKGLDSNLLAALLGGGLAVGIVGFLDDRGHVPAGVRLAVHVVAAIWALWCLAGLPPVRVGDHLVSLGWFGHVLAGIAIVWVLNLFNFMDGIDGIAGSEAVFVTWGAVLLAIVAGRQGGSYASLLFGVACFGFLLWNLPPARIFMGDVGSGYIGFVLAVLCLAAMREDAVALWIWGILGAVFLVDATITLMRRMGRREPIYQAHRSHGYQWLARRWGSHGRVTGTIALVNLLWLFPCALLAASHPRYASWIFVIALLPIAVLAITVGAGRQEGSVHT
jgi:Fuc2NAc and GlcNAc transferase